VLQLNNKTESVQRSITNHKRVLSPSKYSSEFYMCSNVSVIAGNNLLKSFQYCNLCLPKDWKWVPFKKILIAGTWKSYMGFRQHVFVFLILLSCHQYLLKEAKNCKPWKELNQIKWQKTENSNLSLMCYYK